MQNLPEAAVVVLKKVKPLAPDFHRHIVSAQAVGQVVTAGERLLVYRVETTMPQGRVLVTEKTRIEFA